MRGSQRRWGSRQRHEARAADLLLGELAPVLDVSDTEALGGLGVRHDGGCDGEAEQRSGESVLWKEKNKEVVLERQNGGGGALIQPGNGRHQ